MQPCPAHRIDPAAAARAGGIGISSLLLPKGNQQANPKNPEKLRRPPDVAVWVPLPPAKPHHWLWLQLWPRPSFPPLHWAHNWAKPWGVFSQLSQRNTMWGAQSVQSRASIAKLCLASLQLSHLLDVLSCICPAAIMRSHQPICLSDCVSPEQAMICRVMCLSSYLTSLTIK